MNYQKVHEKKTIIREIHIKPTMRYHDTSFEWPYYRRTEPSDREDVEHAQLALLSIWQQVSSFLSPPLSRSFLPSFYLPSSLPFFSFLFQSLSMWFISWWVLEAGATMVRFWWEFSSWLAHSHFKAVFSHRREKRDKGRRDERRRKEGTSSLPIFKKNLNIHLPYNPSILLLGTYLREVKTHVLTKMYARSLELLYL